MKRLPLSITTHPYHYSLKLSGNISKDSKERGCVDSRILDYNICYMAFYFSLFF